MHVPVLAIPNGMLEGVHPEYAILKHGTGTPEVEWASQK